MWVNNKSYIFTFSQELFPESSPSDNVLVGLAANLVAPSTFSSSTLHHGSKFVHLTLVHFGHVEALLDLSLQIPGLFAHGTRTPSVFRSFHVVHFQDVDQLELESTNVLSHLKM